MKMLDFIKRTGLFCFDFEAVWLKDDQCEGVIKNAWEGYNYGDPMNKVISKVEACRTKLQSWRRLSFGIIHCFLVQKKKELAQAKALFTAGVNHEQVRVLKGKVYELMVKEDCLWQ